jgi:hypothetical protein
MRVDAATFLAFGFLPIYMCISTGVEPRHGQIQSSDGSCDR